MESIVYIKKVNEYDDVLKKENKRIPTFLKKIIYIYKNMFNIITKRKVEDNNLWILPMQEKCTFNKLNNIVKKMSAYDNNIYVIASNMKEKELYKLMDKYNLTYLKGDKIKKYLAIKMLEYITNIQNEDISNTEVTVLSKDATEFNIYFIEKLSKLVKSIKVVSKNIYKFKNLEERLYNEFGIALQFSNSYKKSLSKSKIIINLDYGKIDINEYQIFNNAIIINCSEEEILIKSKLFNGIVVNSCNIKYKKEIRDKFRKINIYNEYNSLVLYESYINKEKSFNEIFEKLDEDKIIITNLVGNNGNIDKKEFKNISKKLDKN